MVSIVSALGLPFIVSNGRGGWLCSVCGGGVRSDATACKHCRAVFADVKAAQPIYENALATLKVDPTNADLRERALAIGRAYAALAREQGKVTVFDEVALSNDIAAATAGASSAATAPVASIEERLTRLSDLRAKGFLSDQEFDARRQKILDEI